MALKLPSQLYSPSFSRHILLSVFSKLTLHPVFSSGGVFFSTDRCCHLLVPVQLGARKRCTEA